MLRPSGSEVMGLLDASCCLSPAGSSLKGYGSGPSSSQPFSYCRYSIMSASKSQMFFCKRFTFSFLYKIQLGPCQKIWKNCLLTKRPVYDLMTFVYIVKTLTEIPLLLDAPESRRLVRAGADERCDLLPESVL